MKTFVLIMWFGGGSWSTTSTVDGFSSFKECDSFARRVQSMDKPYLLERWICVEKQ